MTTYRTYLCIAICSILGGVVVPGLDIGVGIAVGAGVGVAVAATDKTTNRWSCRHTYRPLTTQPVKRHHS